MQPGSDGPGGTGPDPGKPDGADRTRTGTQRDEAIDLVALRCDDELIDALAAGLLRGDRPDTADADADAELIAMLEAWVAEVRPETLVERSPAVTIASSAVVGDAVAGEPSDPSVRTGIALAWLPVARPSISALEMLGRVAVAATLIVVGSFGIAVGAWESVPGEPLWGVSKVLYSEHARSVEAAVGVLDGLKQARAALDAGRRDEAAAVMSAVRDNLEMVGPGEGLDLLTIEHDLLAAVMEGPVYPAEPVPGDATDPGQATEPAPSDALALTGPGPSTEDGTPQPAAPGPSGESPPDPVAPDESTPSEPAAPAPPPDPDPAPPPPPRDPDPAPPPPPRDPDPAPPAQPPDPDPAPPAPSPDPDPAPPDPDPAPTSPPPDPDPAPTTPPPDPDPAPTTPPPDPDPQGTPPPAEPGQPSSGGPDPTPQPSPEPSAPAPPADGTNEPPPVYAQPDPVTVGGQAPPGPTPPAESPQPGIEEPAAPPAGGG